jgi:cell wall-associated NlpC family hydrolase
LLAFFLTSASLFAAQLKKKPVRRAAAKHTVKRTVKHTAKRPAKRPTRRVRHSVPRKPLDFATVPARAELTSCPAPSESPLCLNCAQQALSTARAFIGLGYVRGGANPNVGFDCSGFVRHVYASSCGRQLPRRAQEQFAVGDPIDRDALQAGDLVFFRGRQGWHVGIYTGDNHFIHSPNGRSAIKTSSLDAPYYKRSFIGARRIGTELAPMLAADALSFPAN